MNFVTTNVWDTILLSLNTKLSQQTLEACFQPIRFERIDAAQRVITLRAPNQVVKDWVITHYSTMIEDSLKRLLLDGYSLTWLIDGEASKVAETLPVVNEPASQQRSGSFSAAAPAMKLENPRPAAASEIQPLAPPEPSL